MSFNIVIPARYGSTRLPGKPLLDIAGKPMVQRVWEQARRSGAAEVIIATDDQRIALDDHFDPPGIRASGGASSASAAMCPSGTGLTGARTLICVGSCPAARASASMTVSQ